MNVQGSQCQQRGSARGGFTLVDMITTMLVLGIVAAIAAPRYASAVIRFRVDAAAKRVMADLRYARKQARVKGGTQAVVFSPATDSYDLPGLNNVYHPTLPFTVKLATTNSAASLVSASFGAGGKTVTFDAHGRADNAGAVVLEVGLEQRAILINGTSGMVSLQP